MMERYSHIWMEAKRRAVDGLSGTDFVPGVAQNWAQFFVSEKSGEANSLKGSGEPGRTRTSNPLFPTRLLSSLFFCPLAASYSTVLGGIWGVLFSICSRIVLDRWGEPLRWHNFLGHSFHTDSLLVPRNVSMPRRTTRQSTRELTGSSSREKNKVGF
jgi:hypothetical protein